jgi:hypothetical protein
VDSSLRRRRVSAAPAPPPLHHRRPKLSPCARHLVDSALRRCYVSASPAPPPLPASRSPSAASTAATDLSHAAQKQQTFPRHSEPAKPCQTEDPKGYPIWQGRQRPPSRRSPRPTSSCTGTQRVSSRRPARASRRPTPPPSSNDRGESRAGSLASQLVALSALDPAAFGGRPASTSFAALCRSPRFRVSPGVNRMVH